MSASSTKRRARICVVATTPLSVHFFFKPHLCELARYADVSLVVNPENDAYTPDLNLPIRVIPAGIRRPVAPWDDLCALFRLWRLFRQEQFDLVWATAPKAGLLGMVAAWLAGISVRVFVFQGEVWASRQGIWRRVLKAADWVTARFSTHLLAVSGSEARFLEAENVVPVGKVSVLGAGSIGGVDIERYRPDAVTRQTVRSELGIPESATLVLFVGRMVADKGVFELIEAFRQVAMQRSDLWLLMVGPDEESVADDLLQPLGELRRRVCVQGFSVEPEKYMAASDFICLPSHREGFGMVIVEAGAVGIPAIGSRIYGISDAIRDGETGVLVEVKSATALAEAIARFAEDSMGREVMGAAARAYVRQNFERNQVVKRYINYLLSSLPGFEAD